MTWNQRLMRALRAGFERHARVRTLGILRGMDERLLRDLGYSPELLRQGMRAWPWRADQDEGPEGGLSKRQIEIAEAELQAYSDKELADLGLTRELIPDAVRNGRPGIDQIAA